MTNYIKQVWKTIKVRAGGTITAGNPVKYDPAQGAGILAFTADDEEFAGFAIDDMADAATMEAVLLAGTVQMKCVGKLDCLEPVRIKTSVNRMESSITADLVAGRAQYYCSTADTTNRIWPLIFDSTGVGTYWAE